MRTGTFLVVASISAGMLVDLAHADDSNVYRVTTLVSKVVDSKLVNAWGIAANSTGPWWVSDNGSGASTLYTGTGVKVALEVAVPGAPTGIVAYGGSQFELAPDRPARFLFASEDGTISAWNPIFDLNLAHVVFTHPGSVYKGLAIHGDVLFTTDFADCEVEAINGNFGKVSTPGGFEDDSIPEGYCPFGIQAIGDTIFVTYALREPGGDDDVAGVSHGFVRAFDTDGHLLAKVASHGPLNSPWGLALAPSKFGKFSGCLLVGNFGDGGINAYCTDDVDRYHHRGSLMGERGGPLRIDGLWGIGFGNGQSSGPTNVLYFAAGPDDEKNGAFGKIEFMP